MRLYFAILIGLMLLSNSKASAQDVCDSISLRYHFAYANATDDTVIIQVVYTGKNYFNYPVVKLVLNDTTHLQVIDSHQLFLLPDTFNAYFGFRKKTGIIPDSLKARLVIHDFDSIYCEMPLTIYFLRSSTICDSLSLKSDKVFTNTTKDSVTLNFEYTNHTMVVYPTAYIILDDTTDIAIRHKYYMGDIRTDFNLSFPITYKTSNIPDSITGRAVIHKQDEFHCEMPLTIYLNKPNSIGKQLRADGFNFYPNPVNGNVLNVNTPDKGNLIITSLLGQYLIVTGLDKGPNSIPINDLPSGQYIIRFQSENSSASKPLLKTE
jgi:hypothetical protein